MLAVIGFLPRLLGTQNPGTVYFVYALKTARKVYVVTHHSVVLFKRSTHITDNHIAGVNADSRIKFTRNISRQHMLSIEFALSLLHSDCRRTRRIRMIFNADRRTEQADN